ncbi:hypothetical protein ES703_109386 [subsurface metagenome]
MISKIIELLDQQLKELFEISDSIRNGTEQIFEQKLERWQRRTARLIATYLSEDELQNFKKQCQQADWHSPGHFMQDSVERIKMLAAFVENLIEDLQKHPEEIPTAKDSETSESQISPEGLITAGKYFDALNIVTNMFSRAQTDIVIIDRYIADFILSLLPSKVERLHIKILTEKVSEKLLTLATAFWKQYGNLYIRTSSLFHDRFVIIDEKEIYHFGPSIDQHLGKRYAMISRIEEPMLLEQLKKIFEEEWEKADSVNLSQ